MSRGFIILLPVFFVSCWQAVCDDSELSVAGFLESRTLEKVGIRQQELEKVLYDLLDQSMIESPELSGKILPHTRRLVVHEQLHNDGWYESMWNGWTHTGSWFQRYLRARSTLDTLGILTRTFREDSLGTVANLGFAGRSQTDAMVAVFNAGGGNYQPEKGIECLLREMHAVCGDGEMVFLVPYFQSFNYQLRPAQRRAAISWAADQDIGEPLHPIADAFLLGTALAEVSWNRQLGENPVSRSQARLRTRDLLENSQLSLAWRGGFATFLGHENRDCWGSDIGISIGRVVASIFADSTPYASNSFSYAFPLYLDAEDHPEWRETGERIVQSWKQRNRFNKQSKRKGKAFDPSNYWVVPMIDLACRLGDETAIDEMLKEFSSTMHVAPGASMHLVANGYFKRARTLIDKEIEKREYSLYQYRRENVYNEKLHHQLPAFLKTIQRKSERDFAALHFAAVVDPDPFPEDRPFPDREERLREVLAGGDFHVPDAGLKKKRVLEMLSLAARNPEAAKLLREHTPLPENTNDRAVSLGAYWGTRAAIFSELEELEKGFDMPFRFQLGRAAKDESKWFSGNRRRICDGLVTQLTKRLAIACVERDRERLAHFLPVCRLTAESVPLNTGLHSFLIYTAGAHAFLDEMDEYENWWSGLEAPRRKHFARLLQDEGAYISYNAGRFNPGKLRPGEVFSSTRERRRFMRDLLSNPWTDLGYEDRNSLAYSEAKSMLTEEDIHYLAGPLAKEYPRRGCAHREWFGSLADRGQMEEAMIQLQAALPQSESDNYYKECLLWELILLNETLGDEDGAKSALQELREHTEKAGFRMKGYGEDVLKVIEKRLGATLPEKSLAR